jgi:hypothetical protein
LLSATTALGSRLWRRVTCPKPPATSGKRFLSLKPRLLKDRKTGMSRQVLPTAISRWAWPIRLWPLTPRVLPFTGRGVGRKRVHGIKRAPTSGLRNVPAARWIDLKAIQQKGLPKESLDATPLWPSLRQPSTDNFDQLQCCLSIAVMPGRPANKDLDEMGRSTGEVSRCRRNRIRKRSVEAVGRIVGKSFRCHVR